jgi:hypothetical protein
MTSPHAIRRGAAPQRRGGHHPINTVAEIVSSVVDAV